VWSHCHCWTIWRFHSNRLCNRFPILITNIQTSQQQKTNKYQYTCEQKECLGELQWRRTLLHKYTSNAANSQWNNTKQWTISISQHWAHKPTLESTHESLNLCQGSTNSDIKINFTQSDVLIVVTLQYWHHSIIGRDNNTTPCRTTVHRCWNCHGLNCTLARNSHFF